MNTAAAASLRLSLDDGAIGETERMDTVPALSPNLLMLKNAKASSLTVGATVVGDKSELMDGETVDA